MGNLMVFDIGGSSIKFAVWNGESLIECSEKETPNNWFEMKSLLKLLFDELQNKYKFKGVALSSPGAVNVSEGVIYGDSAVPYLHRFPIRKELEEMFQLPVTIENDAYCAALAEVWQGEAKEVNSCIFIIIGTGIGGAYIENGKLLKGRHLFGGEFGWMLLEKNKTLSELGSPVNMAKQFSTTFNGEYSGLDVFKLYDEGDQRAFPFVEKLTENLAKGLYNLSVCFDPELILIGGGVSQRKNLIKSIEIKTNELLERYGAKDISLKVKPCKFLNHSNLIGAVFNFNHTVD